VGGVPVHTLSVPRWAQMVAMVRWGGFLIYFANCVPGSGWVFMGSSIFIIFFGPAQGGLPYRRGLLGLFGRRK
jgi:hypothetical protein